MRATRLRLTTICGFLLPLVVAPALAAEDPTFTLEFRDGAITPSRLEVPANTRFRLELKNSGKTPAEFESKELKKEKVLAAESDSVLVIRTLDPGEYPFFDDFHPDAPPAILVAK
ncbi:hypothetical protein GGD83_001094 [Rhodoblastus sphagnicola]|nr:cupredoxin domain-containing protein [Rhodoblastus sphagnicola]MBB4197308.1 hypothetical protein [Rhodoblastus sphagnicola]